MSELLFDGAGGGIFVGAAFMAGEAGTIFYEPEGLATLRHDPNDVERTVRQIAANTP